MADISGIAALAPAPEASVEPPKEEGKKFPFEAKIAAGAGTEFTVPFASVDENKPATFRGTSSLNLEAWTNLSRGEKPYVLKFEMSFAQKLWELEQRLGTEETSEPASAIAKTGIGDVQVEPPEVAVGLSKYGLEMAGFRVRPDDETVHVDITFGLDNFRRRNINNSVKFVWSDAGEPSISRWGVEARLFDNIPLGSGSGRLSLDAKVSVPSLVPRGLNSVYQEYKGFDALMMADKAGEFKFSFAKAAVSLPEKLPLFGGDVFFIPSAEYTFTTDPVLGLYDHKVIGTLKIASAKDDRLASLGFLKSGIEFGFEYQRTHSIEEVEYLINHDPESGSGPWMFEDLRSNITSWHAKLYFGGDPIPSRNQNLERGISGYAQISGGTNRTVTAAMLDNGAGGFDNIDLRDESSTMPLTLSIGINGILNLQSVRDND